MRMRSLRNGESDAEDDALSKKNLSSLPANSVQYANDSTRRLDKRANKPSSFAVLRLLRILLFHVVLLQRMAKKYIQRLFCS